MQRCPEAYRLARIEGVSRRPSVPALAGTAIHVGTEEVDRLILAGVDDLDTLTRESLTNAETALDSAVDEVCGQGEWTVDDFKYFGFRPAQTLDWYRATGIPNSMRAYAGWRLGADTHLDVAMLPGEQPAVELPFEIQLWEIPIVGFIDRLMIERDSLVFYALDIKSGNKPTTDEQLGLYRYALAEQYGIDVSWGGYVYGLKRGEAKLTPPIDLTHWTKEKLYYVYSRADYLINQGIFLPNPGEACFTCDVSHACRFAQSAI